MERPNTEEKSYKIERSKEEKEAELARIFTYAEERWDKKSENKKSPQDDVEIAEIYEKIDALKEQEIAESGPKKSSVVRIVGKAPKEVKQELLKKYDKMVL